MKPDYNKTIKRFSGFASDYKCYRPQIPNELFQFLYKLLGYKPNVVVDLGCGTGQSTIPWSNHAFSVIGIDPSSDMVKEANETKPKNVSFIVGFGYNTNLNDKSVDIVTCSSSLHWMEPKTTIMEIVRILKERGIFCSYGYYYPFFNESWQLTKAFEEWRQKTAIQKLKDDDKYAKQYNIDESFSLYKELKLFSYIRKTYFHSKIEWSFNDFIGYINLFTDLIDTDKEEMFEIAEKAFENRNLTAIFTYSTYVAIL